MNDLITTVLIPYIPTNYRNYTLAHLFEHIIISEFDNGIGGLTTNDYIMLFCSKCSNEEVVETMESLKIEEVNIERNREKIRSEIIKSMKVRNEIFFRKVWDGTIYEKSPVGTESEINIISRKDLIGMQKKVIKGTIYIYNNYKISIFNKHVDKNNYKIKKINIINKSTFKHDKNYYKRIIFEGESDIFNLICEMLSFFDPNRYVQLIEKKQLSTIILERDFIFPEYNELITLKTKCLKEIQRVNLLLDKSYFHKSMKELISFFYHNKIISDRIKYIFNIDDKEIIESILFLKKNY